MNQRYVERTTLYYDHTQSSHIVRTIEESVALSYWSSLSNVIVRVPNASQYSPECFVLFVVCTLVLRSVERFVPLWRTGHVV